MLPRESSSAAICNALSANSKVASPRSTFARKLSRASRAGLGLCGLLRYGSKSTETCVVLALHRNPDEAPTRGRTLPPLQERAGTLRRNGGLEGQRDPTKCRVGTNSAIM
eukprot:316554-Prorocentrum_minimum.AAC.3